MNFLNFSSLKGDSNKKTSSLYYILCLHISSLDERWSLVKYLFSLRRRRYIYSKNLYILQQSIYFFHIVLPLISFIKVPNLLYLSLSQFFFLPNNIHISIFLASCFCFLMYILSNLKNYLISFLSLKKQKTYLPFLTKKKKIKGKDNTFLQNT